MRHDDAMMFLILDICAERQYLIYYDDEDTQHYENLNNYVYVYKIGL